MLGSVSLRHNVGKLVLDLQLTITIWVASELPDNMEVFPTKVIFSSGHHFRSERAAPILCVAFVLHSASVSSRCGLDVQDADCAWFNCMSRHGLHASARHNMNARAIYLFLRVKGLQRSATFVKMKQQERENTHIIQKFEPRALTFFVFLSSFVHTTDPLH